jgi:hypothetical protein
VRFEKKEDREKRQELRARKQDKKEGRIKKIENREILVHSWLELDLIN